jgi:hypothetical protein
MLPQASMLPPSATKPFEVVLVCGTDWRPW